MTVKRRARRSREEWHRLVQRYEESGLSHAEFCRQEGLNVNTFRFWRSRTRAKDKGASPFVEVVPVPDPESPWTIELELPGGATFRLRG